MTQRQLHCIRQHNSAVSDVIKGQSVSQGPLRAFTDYINMYR